MSTVSQLDPSKFPCSFDWY